MYNVVFSSVVGSLNADGISGASYTLSFVPRIGEKVKIGYRNVVVVDVIHHVDTNKVYVNVK